MHAPLACCHRSWLFHRSIRAAFSCVQLSRYAVWMASLSSACYIWLLVILRHQSIYCVTCYICTTSATIRSAWLYTLWAQFNCLHVYSICVNAEKRRFRVNILLCRRHNSFRSHTYRLVPMTSLPHIMVQFNVWLSRIAMATHRLLHHRAQHKSAPISDVFFSFHLLSNSWIHFIAIRKIF